MFDQLIENGIQKIYTTDLKSQQVFIENICEKVRHMKSDIIYKLGGFFVPNDEYMIKMMGSEIVMLDYDCYDAFGNCKWNSYLVFPIYNVVGEVVGLTGFNPINKLKQQESDENWDLEVYKKSSKRLFEAGNYIFSKQDIFYEARKQGYIILTDGNFDTISALQEGLVAGALLGSHFSDVVISMLKFIDIIYLSVDNDEAGIKLLRQLRRYLPNVRAIMQNKYKDLDDLLKSEYKEEFLKKFEQNRKSRFNLDLVLR